VTPYYQEDGITIYHGDCRDVLPGLASADVLLTDPPYGVAYQSNKGVGQGTNPITNDGTRLSLALYRQVIPMISAGHVLWFTRWDAWPDVWTLLGQYFPIRGLLIWDKESPGMGDLNHWGPSYEMIASVGSGKTVGSRDGSIFRCQTVSPIKRRHPTEKPIRLLTYLLQKLTGEVILDPFVGSGSTLEAAKDLGRRAIGIEIEERYCEIAAKRLSQKVLDFGAAADEYNEQSGGGIW
jgi:site-specific DNA-methyltransferase (adenine-specific)